MKTKLKALAGVVTLGLGLAAAGQANATNWVMLQGTEPDGMAERARLWGFIQPTYRSTSGTELPAGPWAGQPMQPNMIPTDLTSDSQFQLQRARIGVRGVAMPIDSKVNYFFLTEWGDNGITVGKGGAGVISDASITLNHIPGARVRLGLFKTPMSEEIFQGIGTMDYVNFTSFTDQQLNERHLPTDGIAACDPAADTLYSRYCESGNAFSDFGAARDTGAMVFDAFRQGDWEHTYAVMIGNGSGVNAGNTDNNLDTRAYWSSEWIFGGQGPRREGWKLYAWMHDGKRTILDSAELVAGNRVEREYDYERSGLGTTYRRGKYRFFAEYNQAEGMIFDGTDGGAVAGSLNNAGTAVSTFNLLPEEEADAYYLDFGYKVTPKIELDVRYDVQNRGTKSSAPGVERKFETVTLGAQYFFNRKSRLIVNYEFRDLEAPNLPSGAVPNQIGDAIDDRLSLQVFMAF
ncbi:MAG TPA: porin [Phycisphaerales bacterium]|nr:porin [Phycisphaerales bacterium]